MTISIKDFFPHKKLEYDFSTCVRSNYIAEAHNISYGKAQHIEMFRSMKVFFFFSKRTPPKRKRNKSRNLTDFSLNFALVVYV